MKDNTEDFRPFFNNLFWFMIKKINLPIIMREPISTHLEEHLITELKSKIITYVKSL